MYTNKLELRYSDALHDYDIYPKVVPSDRQSDITLKPLGAHAAFQKASYQLSLHPLNEGQPSQFPGHPNNFSYTVRPSEDGCIRFRFHFFGEQEYFVRLSDGEKFELELSLYAVGEDLKGRYPFRGDLHLHSHRSDGRQSPAIVAANYRKTGYDFLALTDHHRYYPSLEAIAAYREVPIELALLPGEEIHIPDDPAGEHRNDVHMVSFGAAYSINSLFRNDRLEPLAYAPEQRALIPNPPPIRTPADHWAEVEQHMQTLDIPEKIKGNDRYLYASCHWVFEEIRRAGGLGIFAHPYWISNVYSIPPALVDYFMETAPFDAFEVLGGENYFEQNGFQAAQYYADRARGRRYPVVGSTDSHRSVNSRNSHLCSTLVFAPQNERHALIDAIRSGYAVAVDTIDETPRFVGEFRLIRYACFLMKNFFPLHDELCFEEGRAMKDYVCGTPGAKETLEFLSGRMQTQREKYFFF